MNRKKATYVVTKDKNGKVISIKSVPVPSLLDRVQRSCEERFSSFLLAVIVVFICLMTIMLVLKSLGG